MKFDVTIFPTDLNRAGSWAQAVETMGFHALWTAETAHNPFLPLTHAAAQTSRIELGTAIAVAFPRSPMITAQIAWDLAAQSNGRFILGLGTQVKAHITKRFGIPWAAPVPRLREYIEAMRAIWQTWQTGAPLRYRGEHYRFSLMTPFFSPGPIENPAIPIYIAGVNEGLCKLAGELCQGFHVHPLHTTRYLREVLIPAIDAGAQSAGRTRADLQLTCALFVATGRNKDEIRASTAAIKTQIAFYASTPSYRPVLDLHGWGDLQERLALMARTGQWAAMGDQISDDIVGEFAVIAPMDELAQAVRARYDELLDRVGYYLPFEPDDVDKSAIWRNAAEVFCR
ncbi:MAG: TIGR03617 family F420-dependent LLM class oxidoreductase [Anaerolineae bacterium]|nr:TIGR03617 family F420-dependent LLM class oxidoreductase [Anaerolineae bacterium]